MSSVKNLGGRLCNKIIINLVFSILAEQNDLYIEYDYNDECENLGIKLFCGINKYNETIPITDSNLIHYINYTKNIKIKSNIMNPGNFYQTNEISNYLFANYFSTVLTDNIIDKNKFKLRYNNNNDIFIHIRLGDVSQYNSGYDYYSKAIKKIKDYTLIYISSDSISHDICNKIILNFSAIPIHYGEVNTIHFGSTCKNVILSHGSFSYVIGCLSFFSNIYYPEYQIDKLWYGDIFSIPSWNKIYTD